MERFHSALTSAKKEEVCASGVKFSSQEMVAKCLPPCGLCEIAIRTFVHMHAFVCM